MKVKFLHLESIIKAFKELNECRMSFATKIKLRDASSLLPSGIGSTIGNSNTSWYLGNFLFLRASYFTLGGKTVNVRAADGVLYVNP